MMRLAEITTKPAAPKPPLSPERARIAALRQGVERSREALRSERERQHQQRELERKRKSQQRLSGTL